MPTKHLHNILLLLAWESIAHGLKTGKPLRINLDDYPEELSQRRASFVLLKQKQLQRGCVGTLEPIRALGEDVAENAFAAAFCDRHFMPLADSELETVQINILLLSALEPMQCATQLELSQQLRPHVDGLMIKEGSHHANLLPTAWDNFKNPRDFVDHLKQQAGLPLTYWSKNTLIYRYTTDIISDEGAGSISRR